MKQLYKSIEENINIGEVDKAIETLSTVPVDLRGLEWYKLNGYANGNLGDYESALFFLGKACQFDPNDLESRYYLAVAQFKNGLLDEAVKTLIEVAKKSNWQTEVVETLVDFAIASKNYVIASDSISKLIQKTKEPEQHIRRQIELAINFSKYEDAIKLYEKLSRLGKSISSDFGHENYLRMVLCDWSKYTDSKKILNYQTDIGNYFSPTQLLSLPSDSKQQFVAASKLASSFSSSSIAKNELIDSPKIKLGYFSSDFHNHATAYLIVEFLELHCRNDFEIHCFSYGPNKNDQLRNRVKNSVDYFHELSRATDDEIIELSRNFNIDIAIDLKGYGINQRLGIFAKRVAPVQVNYLVYPGTMGTSFHDYIIADKYLIPEDQQLFYTEKVLYMDSSYQVSDQKREVSPDAGTKKSWGLKEGHFIFASFNNNYKITPDIFDVWLNILLSVPNSQLWLLEDNSMAKKNLMKYAKKRHLTQDRIVFAPRVDIPRHLARHRHVDLMLDTPYYNAHTTANDALFMGVPILTVEGNTFASRVCGSLLNDVYLDELVCKNLEEYQKQAIALAGNTQKLINIHEHLSQRDRLPLFNTLMKVRNIENLYKSLLN